MSSKSTIYNFTIYGMLYNLIEIKENKDKTFKLP